MDGRVSSALLSAASEDILKRGTVVVAESNSPEDVDEKQPTRARLGGISQPSSCFLHRSAMFISTMKPSAFSNWAE